jgi:Ca2+-binding EF-hand superfamily protein
MEVKKMKGYFSLLIIKLNDKEAEFLKNFVKYENPKTLKITEKYLSKVFSLHLKAVSVMAASKLLENENKLNRKQVNRLFKNLDKSFQGYEKMVKKHFARIGKLLQKKNK